MSTASHYASQHQIPRPALLLYHVLEHANKTSSGKDRAAHLELFLLLFILLIKHDTFVALARQVLEVFFAPLLLRPSNLHSRLRFSESFQANTAALEADIARRLPSTFEIGVTAQTVTHGQVRDIAIFQAEDACLSVRRCSGGSSARRPVRQPAPQPAGQQALHRPPNTSSHTLEQVLYAHYH